MSGRIINVPELLGGKSGTYRKLVKTAANHEIHLWRIAPGGWIYPHIHPGSDDIWHILRGAGDYYISGKERRNVGPGDMAVASPGEVHGIFNSGSETILILSVLAPLPVEFDEAPGFDYPV